MHLVHLGISGPDSGYGSGTTVVGERSEVIRNYLSPSVSREVTPASFTTQSQWSVTEVDSTFKSHTHAETLLSRGEYRPKRRICMAPPRSKPQPDDSRSEASSTKEKPVTSTLNATNGKGRRVAGNAAGGSSLKDVVTAGSIGTAGGASTTAIAETAPGVSL